MNHYEVWRIEIALGLALLLFSACSFPLPTPTAITTMTPTAMPTTAPTVTPAGNTPLVNFYSGPGRFAVAFPTYTQPDLHEDAFENIRAGEQVEIHQVWSRDNGALWLVQYWDYSQEVIAKFTSKELLDKTRYEILLGERAKLSQEQDISLGNVYPGRSMVGEVMMRGLGEYDGSYKARIYLAGHRIYVVAAEVYQANWGDRMALMDPFLESFSIDH